jgi:hypothetical protein
LPFHKAGNIHSGVGARINLIAVISAVGSIVKSVAGNRRILTWIPRQKNGLEGLDRKRKAE